MNTSKHSSCKENRRKRFVAEPLISIYLKTHNCSQEGFGTEKNVFERCRADGLIIVFHRILLKIAKDMHASLLVVGVAVAKFGRYDGTFIMGQQVKEAKHTTKRDDLR